MPYTRYVNTLHVLTENARVVMLSFFGTEILAAHAVLARLALVEYKRAQSVYSTTSVPLRALLERKFSVRLPLQRSIACLFTLLIMLSASHSTAAEEIKIESSGTWIPGTPPFRGRDNAANIPYEVTTLKIGPAALDVFLPAKNGLLVSREILLRWVKDAAFSVATY